MCSLWLSQWLSRLRSGSSTLDTVSVYLALIGFEFEIEEPPELLERVRWLGERFTRAAAPTP